MKRIAVMIAAAAMVVALLMTAAGPGVAQQKAGKAGGGKAKAAAKQAPMPQTGGIPLSALAAPAGLGAGVLLVGGGMLIRRKMR